MRVLYLSASLSLAGRSSLRGRQFCELLRHEQDLLIRHQFFRDRQAVLADNPTLATDVTDQDELDEFDPQVIICENGPFLGDTRPEWKIPPEVLELQVRRGTALIIEGCTTEHVRFQRVDNLKRMFELAGSWPLRHEIPQGSDNVYVIDQVSHDGRDSSIVCDPALMPVADWLRPSFEGIDRVVAVDPMPLNPGAGVLATTNGSATLMRLDRFVEPPSQYQWASVRQVGHGHVALLAAGVTHDRTVGPNPDNALWVSNLALLLANESERNLALHNPGNLTPSARKVRALDDLIAAGESHRVEFKRCAVVEKYMQDEFAITIAAFANSDGGTLLVGVEDDGQVTGVDLDLAECKTLDSYERRLNSLARKLEPPMVGSACLIKVTDFEGRQVVVVEVEPSPTPVWYKPRNANDSELYVRTNGTSQKLAAQELAPYIGRRFRS